MENFKGLNFYNGIIICHYNNNRKKVYNELKKRKKYEVETLLDNEILVYKNNVWTKL